MAIGSAMYYGNGIGHHVDPCDHDVTGESFDAADLYGECCCPVCNTSDIEYEDTELDVPDTVYVDYKCRKCGSEFSIRYEFTGAYVMTDGRYDHEEE